MKRVLAVVCMLLLSVAYASEIDWASMTDEQIQGIIAEGQAELDARNGAEVKEVTVPVGVWIVGEDIPAGHWTIKAAPNDNWSFGLIEVGTKLDGSGKSIDYYESDYFYSETINVPGGDLSLGVDETDYDFKDGDVLIIEYSNMIFTPFAGKPKLGF